MNKTVTANISGIVFHIESQAYEKLHNYLTTIRNYFHDSDGKDEIMADIESRIAELFKESLSEGKDVVTMAEVQRVVEIMGEPEQYMDESAEDYEESDKHGSHSKEKFRTKKLFRDPDDKMMGGVCSGLGHYFGIDRIWLRALFLIAVFIGFGSGIIIYFILWAIIPKANTTAEKLEMKGEPINVDSIGNSIKDEFNNFKKKVNDSGAANYGSKAQGFLYRLFDFIGKILLFSFKFIAKFIAVILIFISVVAIISFIALFTGSGNISFNEGVFDGYWSLEFLEIFFSSGSMFVWGMIAVSLVFLIPLLGILYGGIKILFNIKSSNKAVGLVGLSLWILGIIILFITASSTVRDYSSDQHTIDTIVLDSISSDTLELAALEEYYSKNSHYSKDLSIEENKISTDNLEVDVIKSKSGNIELYIDKSSRGANRKDAGNRAKNIEFEYELSGNKLSISQFISSPIGDGFRNQEISISIGLPEGKTIYLDKSSSAIIYDIKNVTNTYDNDMMGHHWKMTTNGLECSDCEWLKTNEDEE